MKIRKFNESYWKEMKLKWDSSPKIWCVVTGIKDVNGIEMEYSPSSHFSCHCFNSEILAADYIIQYVNYFHSQKFESFFDKDDGSRFFINVDENDDYINCLLYCQENDIDIKILKGKQHNSPKVIRSI